MNERALLDKKTLLYDSLMVFLNLSASYSIIPYLLFFQNQRQICFLFIVLINIVYIATRFNNFIICHEPLIVIYILMHIVSLVSAVLNDAPPYSIIAYLFLNSSFYYLLFLLNNEYKKVFNLKERLWYLTRGYIWLVSICLVSCFSLLMLKIAGFSLLTNRISSGIDLFSSNINNMFSAYFSPYYLGIVLGNTETARFEFFHRGGIICGLYHEPHILAQMTFPALFLLLFFFPKRRKLTLIKYLLILLIAGSTMNILSVLLCCVIFILWKYRSSLMGGVVSTVAIVSLFFIVVNLVDSTIFQFVFDKLNMENSGSMRYSSVLLNFAVSPKTLLGTSFYDTVMINTLSGFSADKDVGYLNCFFNIGFLVICIYYLFKHFKSKAYLSLSLLLFGSYFILHSAKLAMVSYSLTMLTFIAFIISHVFAESGNQIKRI